MLLKNIKILTFFYKKTVQENSQTVHNKYSFQQLKPFVIRVFGIVSEIDKRSLIVNFRFVFRRKDYPLGFLNRSFVGLGQRFGGVLVSGFVKTLSLHEL